MMTEEGVDAMLHYTARILLVAGIALFSWSLLRLLP